MVPMADMHARLALPATQCVCQRWRLAMISEALTHGLRGLPRARGGHYVQSLAWWTTGGNAIYEHTQVRHFTDHLGML